MTSTNSELSWAGAQAVRVRRHWAWLLVVTIVVVGLAMVPSHWRHGLVVIGSGALVAAALRAVLSPRRVSLLVVRSRAFDVAALLVLGGAVITLSAVIPPLRR